MNSIKEKNYQVIIIGGGPAGIQTGYFLKKSKIDYVVIEKGEKVSQSFRKFPRHRNLISINKVNNDCGPEEQLRYDWNSLISDEMKPIFSDYSKEYFPCADDLTKYIEDFTEHHQINVQYNTEVLKVSKKDGKFQVQFKDGEVYVTDVVVSAAGFGGAFIPKIPGIEHVEHYYDAPIEGEHYKNKKVFILGKGNSAFEFAKGLLNYSDTTYLCSPTPIKEASSTHYVGSVRAVNNLSFEAYQLKSKNILIDGNLAKIERKENGKLSVVLGYVVDEELRIEVDHVINCTGFKMNTSIFDEEIMPQMRCCTKLPLVDEVFQSVNIPGLYFAGCLMHSCDYKRGTSGFVHGFRHNIQFLYRYLLSHHFDRELEYTKIENYDELCKFFMYRTSETPEIFLQVVTLCDAVVIRKGKIQYYKGLRYDYVLSSKFKKEEGDILMVLYLNYGKFHQTTTSHPRPVTKYQSHCSPYIHPYYFIYKYINGELRLNAEFQIREHVENKFNIGERAERLIDLVGPTLDKVAGSDEHKKVMDSFSFPVERYTLDNEMLITKLIGSYKTIDLAKKKTMPFMDLLPFEYVKDAVVYAQSQYAEGYSFEVKSKVKKDELWTLRIHTACVKTGLVKLELVPHDLYQVSLLPVELEIRLIEKMSHKNAETQEVEVLMSSSSDLSRDLRRGIVLGVKERTESILFA